MFYERVLYPPLNLSLMGWHRTVLRSLFGTVQKADGKRQYRRAYISTAKQNGKAMALNTSIPTPTGWSTMGKLRAGDSVFDESGAVCTVIAVGEVQTGRPCFEVGFSDGCKIIADAEHEWLTRSRTPRGKSKIRTTAEIAERGRIESPGSEGANHSIVVAGAIECPADDYPIPPYVLGAWLGDGTSTTSGYTVSRKDASILTEFEREGVCWHEHKAGRNKSPDTMTVRLGGLRGRRNFRNRASLQRTLRLAGLLGNKHIPAAYLRGSIGQRFELLQGLMDTDGYCSMAGQCEFTTIKPRLAGGVLELLRSLGFKPTSYIHPAMLNGRVIGDKIRIQFWPSPGQRIFRLARKAERIREPKCNKSRMRQILSVTPVESVPVRCIQVDSPSHLFLAGESMIPTHNSFITGGMPIYHMLMEDELNPEAYGAAAAKEQAGIVFKAAAMLVNANPDLRARLKVVPSTKRIVRRDGGGTYQVLSADGDVQDGIRPSLLIRDEMHRWRSKKAETLYDVTTKGQISRDEPLDIAITTAGAEYESPLWFGEYEFAKKVLEGSLISQGFYPAIWEADKKKADSDPEYWKSREARVLANPSHEDLGGFLKDAAIVRELDKALAQPAQKSKYLRYHLNLPIATQQDPIIDMAKWQACGGDVDLRDWPTYDFELLIRKWGLLDKKCHVGVDASWTTDFTSVVFGFEPFDGNPWTFLPFFFVPEERVPELERICRLPFADWVERGFVTATSGNAIDLRVVKDRIRWGREMFELQDLAFDRCNFRTEAMELQDEGINAIEVQQNFMQLSYPTKFILAKYLDREIRHGNNPVYNWHAACLQLQYDRKDNCQPTKPERLKSSKRIDGMAATVTLLSRALVAESDTMPYTGLRSLN
jgi:phage terminase large subunit-like protein